MLGATGSVGRPELGPDHPRPHPVEIRVGPLGGGPGGRELDVGAQVHLVQLVVNELSDIKLYDEICPHCTLHMMN